MTRAEIRINILNSCTGFLEECCWYNYQEQQAVIELLKILEPVKKEAEAYNEKHAKQRHEEYYGKKELPTTDGANKAKEYSTTKTYRQGEIIEDAAGDIGKYFVIFNYFEGHKYICKQINSTQAEVIRIEYKNVHESTESDGLNEVKNN